MNDKVDDNAFYFVVFMFIAVACFSIGVGFADNSFKKEAVKLGHATWVADADGNSKFQWVEIKQIDKK